MTKILRAAILKLRESGVFLPLGTTHSAEVVTAIEAATTIRRQYKEAMGEFIERYVNPPRTSQQKWQPSFRPLKIHPHLRQAEIEAFPHQVSMGGVGNFQNRIREDG